MATSPNSVLPPTTRSSAEFPKIEIHSRMNVNGTVMVPTTNWRRVRPREIRARNSPTKGAHAIHHAQKNSVQALIHSCGAS